MPARLADEALGRVLDAGAGAGAQAVSVVFPYVRTAAELAELISQLARLSGWHAREVADAPQAGHVAVGLRWRLRGADGLVSWVLGFGPFAFVPFTRRAPFTAIAFRSAPEWSIPRRHEDGATAVHLADITGRSCDVDRDRRCGRSRSVKENLLAGELAQGARASVSFLLPERYRAELGFPVAARS